MLSVGITLIWPIIFVAYSAASLGLGAESDLYGKGSIYRTKEVQMVFWESAIYAGILIAVNYALIFGGSGVAGG